MKKKVRARTLNWVDHKGQSEAHPFLIYHRKDIDEWRCSFTMLDIESGYQNVPFAYATTREKAKATCQKMADELMKELTDD